ncbi:hypothetical protein KKH39_02925 [Patescibacteria group bacterium]|nr:hypothetical protein [Patescibacteria group bacterium]
MNAFAFSSLVTSIWSFVLASFVFIKNKNRSSILWARTSVSIGFWSMGLFGVTFFKNYQYAYLSQIILDIGAIFLPVFFVDFVANLTEEGNKYKKFIRFNYIFAIFLSLFSLTPYFKTGLKSVFNFEYWINPGPLYFVFPVFFMVLAIFSVFLLISNRKMSLGLKRQQIKYVLYSAFIGFGGGAFNFLPQFSHIYPIGNYLVGFYALAITYAIIKYRLMNIRLILTRSILYGVLVAAVAAFFALSVLVVGEAVGGNTKTSKIITYIITSFIVVVFLDPVKRTWAKVTDKIFYKDKIDYQDALQQASTILAREIDLQKLLQKLSKLLTIRLKIKNIAVLIPENGIFYSVKPVLSEKNNPGISVSQNFVAYLNNNKELCIIEEIIRGSKEGEISQQTQDFIKEAENLKIEVVVPIVESENITAIFLISAKQSGDLYNDDDVNFFKVLTPQVANAIEKSKLYEEVEQFNRELQQKVEDRTKDLKQVNLALEDRNKFLTTMQVVINMVSRTLDLKKVNQMIADSIAKELGYVGGILSFVDSEKKVLRVGAITSNENAQKAFRMLAQEPREYETNLENNYNLSAQTFLNGKINFSDKMSDFLSPPVEKEAIDKIQEILGIKTVVGVPIFSEAKIIGVIQFYLPVKQDKISALDIEIMTALTNQVGIVSRNLKLYKNLQKANMDLQDANIRLRELDKAKSEFLSIASHQLRTPISAIKGYLSMMIDGDFGKIPPSISAVIANLFESSARLARLINIFLNVSRIESGRLKLEKKPIQINDMIESVMMELVNQANQKGVKLKYKKAKKAPPLILADADKLREVVLNLVDNAIKYTPEGKIDVMVEYDKANLKFLVKDTGIGIDPMEAKTLFRKFVRGSGVAQIHTGGSGLGLFIAQKIIKEHGGNIWVESEGKGKGSVFQFEIPIYDGHEVPEYKKEAEDSKSK